MRTEEEIRTELRVMLLAKRMAEEQELIGETIKCFQTKAETLAWVLNDKEEK